MERWRLPCESLVTCGTYVQHNGEYILASLIVVLLVALAYIGLRARSLGEEARIMKKAKEFEEQRRVADALTEVLDNMDLAPERRAFYQKRLGKAMGLQDMVPRKLFSAMQRHKKPVENPPAINTESVNDAVKEGKDVLALFKSGNAATS